MRRISIITSSLVATVVAFFGGINPAFATRVVPTSGDTGRSVAHSAGLAVWQTSLIAVASLVVLIAAVSFATRFASHRSTLRPAVR